MSDNSWVEIDIKEVKLVLDSRNLIYSIILHYFTMYKFFKTGENATFPWNSP